MGAFSSAAAISEAVRTGRISAVEVASATLSRIRRLDPTLNTFTAIFEDEALSQAARIDLDRARGRNLGPLAGAPFAVKNLFDVAGRTSLAGSKIRLDARPATTDAELVARLKAAGAVLVGALNMDEFAYGFVTENAHFGATRNPHDLTRIAGGSSGGSAAAVAAGLVPLSLGSDTNGSIRIPAGLCGVFGLKPTSGRLPVEGMFPFVHTLDHAGLFARSLADLAVAYDAGIDAGGESISARLEALAAQPLRTGVLGGWFAHGLSRQVVEVVEAVGAALNSDRDVILAGAEAARSAAFCLTAFEGGRLHLPDLASRIADYDPAVGGRLLAGALLPRDIYDAALAYRRSFTAEVLLAFKRYDVLIAPITLGPAPPIGQEIMVLDGERVSIRKNLGLYTQPISFVGAPVIAAPIRTDGLPLGVQIIAAPGREDLAFAAAARLEQLGLATAMPPRAEFTSAEAPYLQEALRAHK